MKFNLIICDAPWSFSDPLSMSSVKRGAKANYGTMSIQDIIDLPINKIASPDGCVLALWVPSSLLPEGIRVMNAWGFDLKQTFIWVKSKKRDSLETIVKKDVSTLLTKMKQKNLKLDGTLFSLKDMAFNLGDWLLGIGLGRLFRQSHEICLIGINNTKIYSKLKNKAQRSVCFSPNIKHSSKPDNLHQSLDIMFPDMDINKLEIFARRQYTNYICIGNQSPMSDGEDITLSINKLITANGQDEIILKNLLYNNNYSALKTKWEKI